MEYAGIGWFAVGIATRSLGGDEHDALLAASPCLAVFLAALLYRFAKGIDD